MTDLDIPAKFEALTALVTKEFSEIKAEQKAQGERIARLEGRIADMPMARDFGHLEGRLDEISRRLPVPIGYAPPDRRTPAG